MSEDGGLARLLAAAGQRQPPGPERSRRVRTALHAAWRGEIAARRRRALLLGAGGLAAALATLTLWRPAPVPVLVVATVERAAGRLAPGERLLAGTVVELPEGARASLAMAGLSLRLDGRSAVRLLEPAAVELLRGALYVDAGPAAHATLAVHTPRGELRHQGTQFEARLLPGALRVRVREGRVELRTLRGPPQIVDAGEELLASAAGLSRRSVPGHGPDWAWVAEASPGFALDGSSLRDFLAWTARELGLQPRIAPAARQRAGEIRLHGALAGLAPGEALQAVMPTTALRARVEGGDLVVD